MIQIKFRMDPNHYFFFPWLAQLVFNKSSDTRDIIINFIRGALQANVSLIIITSNLNIYL